MEVTMKTPVLVAVVCAGLPGCAAQDPAAPASPDSAVFAAGALPARPSTGPAPQLGTVAPTARVLSHVETPSMRAMARATAAREAQETGAAKKISPSCALPPAPDRAPSGGLDED
jgi:hypothetical protein